MAAVSYTFRAAVDPPEPSFCSSVEDVRRAFYRQVVLLVLEMINGVATRAATSGRIATGREAAKGENAADKQQAAAELARKQAIGTNTPLLEAETKSIQVGGYAEQAEALMAQTWATGGAFNRFGQFHRLSEAQQFDFVPIQMEALLKQRRLGMEAGQRFDLAMRITSMARDQYQRRMAELQMRGITGVEAAQEALAQTQEAVGMLAARLSRLEGNARRLTQNGARLAGRADEQQPTALNNGGPN
jgi:hypothetical protein